VSDFHAVYSRQSRRQAEKFPTRPITRWDAFRVEWGPVFCRGLHVTAHETIARRILISEGGQRFQGGLARLGSA
jgi:hypothetical protein